MIRWDGNGILTIIAKKRWTTLPVRALCTSEGLREGYRRQLVPIAVTSGPLNQPPCRDSWRATSRLPLLSLLLLSPLTRFPARVPPYSTPFPCPLTTPSAVTSWTILFPLHLLPTFSPISPSTPTRIVPLSVYFFFYSSELASGQRYSAEIHRVMPVLAPPACRSMLH